MSRTLLLLASLGALCGALLLWPPPRLAQAAAADATAAADLVQQLAANPDAPVNLGLFTTIGTAAYQALQTGNYAWLAGMALILVVYLMMKIAKPRVPWFSTPVGGLAFVEVISTCGAVGSALLATGSKGLSAALVLTALKVGFFSAGGYALAKRILDEHFPKWHDLLFPPAAPVAAAVSHV